MTRLELIESDWTCYLGDRWRYSLLPFLDVDTWKDSLKPCQALEFPRRWCSEESTLLGLRIGRNCAWATILMLHPTGQQEQ